MTHTIIDNNHTTVWIEKQPEGGLWIQAKGGKAVTNLHFSREDARDLHIEIARNMPLMQRIKALFA